MCSLGFDLVVEWKGILKVLNSISPGFTGPFEVSEVIDEHSYRVASTPA